MTRQLLLATAAYWYSADLNNLMDNSSRFSGPAILGGFGAVSERGPDEVWRGPSRPPSYFSERRSRNQTIAAS